MTYHMLSRRLIATLTAALIVSGSAASPVQAQFDSWVVPLNQSSPLPAQVLTADLDLDGVLEIIVLSAPFRNQKGQIIDMPPQGLYWDGPRVLKRVSPAGAPPQYEVVWSGFAPFPPAVNGLAIAPVPGGKPDLVMSLRDPLPRHPNSSPVGTFEVGADYVDYLVVFRATPGPGIGYETHVLKLDMEKESGSFDYLKVVDGNPWQTMATRVARLAGPSGPNYIIEARRFPSFFSGYDFTPRFEIFRLDQASPGAPSVIFDGTAELTTFVDFLPTDIHVFDPDGDGRSDIAGVIAGPYGGGIQVRLVSAESVPTSGPGKKTVEIKGTDKDINPENLYPNWKDMKIPENFDEGIVPHFGLASGDLDLDGVADLVIAGPFPHSDGQPAIMVQLSSAEKPFTIPLGLPAAAKHLHAETVAVGKIGAARPDIVVTVDGATEGLVVVLRDTSTSGPLNYQPYWQGSFPAPFGAAIGDVTGDGKPDIVIGSEALDHHHIIVLTEFATAGTPGGGSGGGGGGSTVPPTSPRAAPANPPASISSANLPTGVMPPLSTEDEDDNDNGEREQPGRTTGTARSNQPTTAASAASGFSSQASYTGDCARRPAGTVCVEFPDGYIWLVSDSITGYEDRGSVDGHRLRVAIGGRAEYHHLLNTTLVKTQPKR